MTWKALGQGPLIKLGKASHPAWPQVLTLGHVSFWSEGYQCSGEVRRSWWFPVWVQVQKILGPLRHTLEGGGGHCHRGGEKNKLRYVVLVLGRKERDHLVWEGSPILAYSSCTVPNSLCILGSVCHPTLLAIFLKNETRSTFPFPKAVRLHPTQTEEHLLWWALC